MGARNLVKASCPACAKSIDPLRAGHVAVFGESFYYFCDLPCKEVFLRGDGHAKREPGERSSQPPAPPVSGSYAASAALPVREGVSRPHATERESAETTEDAEPSARSHDVPANAKGETPEGRTLTLAAVVAGVLSVALALAGALPMVTALRLAFGLLGLLALAWGGLRARDPADAHPMIALLPGAAALGIAVYSSASGERSADEAVTFAGLVVAALAAEAHLVERGRQTLRAERHEMQAGKGLETTNAPPSQKHPAATRVSSDWTRRADHASASARLGRLLADRGGIAALILGALAAFANNESPVQVALFGIAGFVAVGSLALRALPALHVSRGILAGLRRGIVYRSARDWDRAADVSIAAFCARGTLLLGEPELADLEPVGNIDPSRVLALVAGAETSTVHPVALAVQRAVAARGIRPDGVRSPSVHPGLGVTAVASTGETLVVGNRALMLKEKISVALAERKIEEIEAHGRTVLLLALSGKLVGVIGLQDGLRPGARAAVQHLLDSEVEPVLLSGDARETCEAIGRALDIEHIRPEILPADRAREIGRLAEGGPTVAVLGHAPADEAAMGAAAVAVALSAGSSVSGEWAVALISDDVRDAALAISLARRTRADARTAMVLALSPGVIGALAVAFGLVPPAYAPLAALLGAVASTLHARATDLSRGGDKVATPLALP